MGEAWDDEPALELDDDDDMLELDDDDDDDDDDGEAWDEGVDDDS